MEPETIKTFKLLVENLRDEELAVYARIVAREFNRRGRSTLRVEGVKEYAEILLKYQRPG